MPSGCSSAGCSGKNHDGMNVRSQLDAAGVARNIGWGVGCVAIWLCLVVAASLLAHVNLQYFGVFFFLAMEVFPYIKDLVWLNLFQWLAVAVLFGLSTPRWHRWPRFWLAGGVVLIVTILSQLVLGFMGIEGPRL